MSAARSTCPACGAGNPRPIQYGLVTEFVPGREEVLGGCCIFEDSPNWCCRDCDHRWLVGPGPWPRPSTT
jgi:hypothetical protein